MTAYIATFHTHLSALLTCRALTAAGVAAQMMPVPRAAERRLRHLRALYGRFPHALMHGHGL